MNEERDESLIAAAVDAGRWIREFRSLAHHLNAYPVAGQWWRLRLSPTRLQLSPAEAAAWANSGYLPGEAAPLIVDGVTPEMAAEMGQLATGVAGSPEEHAMQVIDRLVAEGTLVDPQRVRLEQDPDDPDHTIVHIQPEDR